jgi:peptidoglycan-associated lipoprotein
LRHGEVLAMNTRSLSLFLGLLLVGATVGATGCDPTYPNCETDKHCKKDPKEYCVNKKCAQCRDARDCGEGQACNAGRCNAIEGYCRDASQCPGGQVCVGNRCRACTADNECPSGLKCRTGSCTKAQCSKDDECAQDQECKNGFCVAAVKTAATCRLESVYFDFDKSTLNTDATATLNNNANEIKKNAKTVNLVGRADSRGTPEYNMALSDRRAQAAKEYLQRLGIQSARLVPVPRGELDATGTEESGWAKDRRVDGECQ